jgi:hypothetical protein
MEEIKAYAQRGRYLEKISTAELQDRWVAAVAVLQQSPGFGRSSVPQPLQS